MIVNFMFYLGGQKAPQIADKLIFLGMFTRLFLDEISI